MKSDYRENGNPELLKIPGFRLAPAIAGLGRNDVEIIT
jgi:hypothetical protein